MGKEGAKKASDNKGETSEVSFLFLDLNLGTEGAEIASDNKGETLEVSFFFLGE